MQTLPGHHYRIGLAIARGSASARDPDVLWLAGPVTAALPGADVVSIHPSPEGAVTVLSWRGPPGAIDVGSRVEGGLPGLPSMAQEVTSSSATVISVDDLGRVYARTSGRAISPGWSLLFAVALLGYVGYSAHRIARHGAAA